MPEREDELTSIRDADFHICIFPHLDEFIVLDARDPSNPSYRLVPAGDLMTADYYQEVEKEFSRLLHAGKATPFANLITLPQRLEAALRRKGIQRLTQVLHERTTGMESPRVSIFLCAGPILALSEEDISAAMEGFFEGGPSKDFISGYGVVFRKLLQRERMGIKAREMDELRKAVEGRSSQFFTLWQSRQGPPSAN